MYLTFHEAHHCPLATAILFHMCKTKVLVFECNQISIYESMLCSWARHSTLTVPLSIHVYKWVPANLMQGANGDGLASYPGGVEILLWLLRVTEAGMSSDLMATWLVCRSTLLLPLNRKLPNYNCLHSRFAVLTKRIWE